jgi:hypothetical protein
MRCTVKKEKGGRRERPVAGFWEGDGGAAMAGDGTSPELA